MRTKLVRKDLSVWRQFRAHLAVFAANTTRRVLRALKRGATVLPGLVALQLDPKILQELAAERKIILVTGTNGKTTTVKLLVSLLQAQGYVVVTNPSGANMEDGLTSAFLENYAILQKAPQQGQKEAVFVMEVDEAYFSKLTAVLPVQIVVLTNLFRDQLDRYGELATTRQLIKAGLDNCQNITFITCSDDAVAASLLPVVKEMGNLTASFGMDKQAMQAGAITNLGDGTFCQFCHQALVYQAHSFAHLGDYHCEKCGFKRPQPELSFAKQSSGYLFNYQGDSFSQLLGLSGNHNAYNACAALLACLTYLKMELGQGACLDPRQVAQTLASQTAAFGRLERIELPDQKSICLMLVKNPAGLDLGLQFVSQQADLGALAFCLNARVNDGKDVSWIWDADFETQLADSKALAERMGIDYQILLAGERASDMAARLYYANYAATHLKLVNSYAELINSGLKQLKTGQCLYCLPNYTCMLALREQLQKEYGLKEFWQANQIS